MATTGKKLWREVVFRWPEMANLIFFQKQFNYKHF